MSRGFFVASVWLPLNLYFNLLVRFYLHEVIVTRRGKRSLIFCAYAIVLGTSKIIVLVNARALN